MSAIEKRQVCKCENCGNEAEMVVTCTLPDEPAGDPQDATAQPQEIAPAPQQVKGQATCTHCGNEADMWIDI